MLDSGTISYVAYQLTEQAKNPDLSKSERAAFKRVAKFLLKHVRHVAC